MTALIIGGASSGKSAYGEELACRLAGSGSKVYIATMLPSSHEETAARIASHQAQRRGKGFAALEKGTALGEIFLTGEETLLVECLSNLLANEMYQAGQTEERAARKIVRELCSLAGRCRHLIAISNNIFEDSFAYEEETQRYIAALGWINCRLAECFDEVTEVVYGIPCRHKGGKNR